SAPFMFRPLSKPIDWRNSTQKAGPVGGEIWSARTPELLSSGESVNVPVPEEMCATEAPVSHESSIALLKALDCRALPPIGSNGSPYSLREQLAPVVVAPQSRECAWSRP